jgi:hypothetical protein
MPCRASLAQRVSLLIETSSAQGQRIKIGKTFVTKLGHSGHPAMPPDGAAPRRRLAGLLRPGASAASVAPPDVVGGESEFTFAQVAQHSGPADCWVVVRDKVYDVTSWCVCAPDMLARGGGAQGDNHHQSL